ncbi:aldehyde dehydrogenase family protein [Xanthomonas sp. D-109]|uniref:aldehyde dehydrogenase family protein n=1 Tax=Xanthomonas sp. D-109 TaxID=2821274 RepID=UPI001ADC3C77|nr:aldehyde dehydrogenase family protein [Xanthomonas sp. D-109]MBO9880037.1 aldehyde dehydrogenase family protein [Xanthomonas sp. D-109]
MSPEPVQDTAPETIAALFAAHQATALAWRGASANARRARLRALRDALLARRQALVAAFAADFAKPALEVELTEVLPVVDEIATAIAQLPRWMRPRKVSPTLLALGTRARIAFQPKGRCLIIGPWNYPVVTVLGPLVSALAAGNTALIKPSEFTPQVNAVLQAVLEEAFAPEEVALVQGGAATAQALLACPFDHVFFTGSAAVGRQVMAAAARQLTPVTLELGGKSPVIVDRSADLRRAAEVIVWAKLVNAGQTCIAPDTLFVHRDVSARLLEHCRALLVQRYGGDAPAVAASPHLARMIHPAHAARVAALIDEARASGAQLLAGGEHDAARRYVAPTLLGQVPAQARIAQEEIFGPVLPVIEFEHLEEVLDRLDAAPKPLALYLWSRDRAGIARVLARTSSGSAVVNHCLQQFVHSGLPFGGVGASGFGSAHGVHGFRTFSHERALLHGGRLPIVKAFFPPYTALQQRLATGLSGWLARR